MDRFSRYLYLMDLAKRRYTANGVLVVRVGGQPSRFKRIESFLFDRLLAC